MHLFRYNTFTYIMHIQMPMLKFIKYLLSYVFELCCSNDTELTFVHIIQKYDMNKETLFQSRLCKLVLYASVDKASLWK